MAIQRAMFLITFAVLQIGAAAAEPRITTQQYSGDKERIVRAVPVVSTRAQASTTSLISNGRIADALYRGNVVMGQTITVSF